ncbi:MAG TPA: DUF58 domain-containing protein [Candidatus Limnocylindria bacterium]|nr:DUF58 domain-containing protein [Candidatus Limnocylindria bacterium]
MALTGRLALLALVGAMVVAALVGGAGWSVRSALLAVDGLLVAAVLLDLALAGSVRALQLTRAGDTRVRLGEAATVDLLVSNPGRRPVRGRLRDAWPPSAGVLEQRHLVAVPPGERRRVTSSMRPTRRGDRRAARVTVRSTGPLGLAARQGSHVVPWTVRTLPPFTSRKHLPSKLARLRELDGRTAVMVRGQGTEFDSLREYVDGDDVRSIDWRATARAGDLVVRTWRPERDRHVLIVLDTGRTAAGRVGDAPRLDAAMDAALLLAALASKAGDRVDLIAHDRLERASVVGASSTELLHQLVQAMAPLDASLVETDWRAVASTILRRAGHRSLVVLLTALDPAPLEEGLLPVLPLLARKHHVLLASVADPRVAELGLGRGDADAVYGAAAAAQATAARRHLEQVLRRQGVDVVDAGPDALPPRLADAYLALKAAGRL